MAHGATEVYVRVNTQRGAADGGLDYAIERAQLAKACTFRSTLSSACGPTTVTSHSNRPVGSGVSVGIVELAPGDYGGDANWHTTQTIDVDVVLSGYVELHLPDTAPVVLRPGDIVVQRGTHHRWQPVGSDSLRMATVMISLVSKE